MLINYKPISRNRWEVRVNRRKVGTVSKHRGAFVAALPRYASAIVLSSVNAFMDTLAKR